MEKTLLRLGCKASNEQFALRELLDYSILAEQVGMDWCSSATTCSRGAMTAGMRRLP